MNGQLASCVLVLVSLGLSRVVAADTKLYVSSEPAGARVFIDGKSSGKKTPAFLQVDAGIVKLALELEGHVTRTVQVRVPKNSLRKIRLELQPTREPKPSLPEKRPGHTLRILVERPEGAAIFLDRMQLVAENGKPYLTPIQIRNVPEGIYDITIAKEGYRDLSVRYKLDGSARPITGNLAVGRSAILSRPYYFMTLLQILPPAKPGQGEEHLAPIFPKVQRGVELNRITPTKLAGGAGGRPIAFIPREGAVLVGFNFCEGVFAGHRVIRAIQPIFLSPRGEILGRWYGTPADESAKRTLAKSGHAVAAVVAKGGDRLDGFAVLYAPIAGGRLHLKKAYRSEWYGGTGGGKEQLSGGTGNPVVGILGRSGAEIDSLGLILLR